MSEGHDLNHDVANHTHHKRSLHPASTSQERDAPASSTIRPMVRRGRDHQQDRRNGHRPHQNRQESFSRPNGFNHFRKPVIDPSIREQRRIFYQTHYNKIDSENNNNNSTKRYRNFRTAHTSKQNAHCDPIGSQQKPLIQAENGDAKSCVETGSSDVRGEESVATRNSIVVNERDRIRGCDDKPAVFHSHSDQRRHQIRNDDNGVKQAEISEGRGRSMRNKGRKKKKTDSGKEGQSEKGTDDKWTEGQDVKDEGEVVALEEESVDDEAKDCPLCMEPLDPTECNLYPCSYCKFQICLFCLNRLKQEVGTTDMSDKRLCGSCPGCRNPYPADSDDESMAVAIRMTKKRAKGTSDRATKGTNRSSKPETLEQNNTRPQPGNQRPGVEILPQAKRPLVRNDHRQHRIQQSDRKVGEKAPLSTSAGGEDRWTQRRQSSSSSHSRRDRRPTRPQVQTVTGSKEVRVRNGRMGGTDRGSRAGDQKEDATSIREESTEEKKQELVSLLSSLGLSPCNIRFHPQRQES